MKLKLSVIVLAILLPIITVYFYGYSFKSLSKLWGTNLEFLFIITNAVTSYFMFRIKKWEIPAICLLLTTALNTNIYPDLHNFCAGAFFISALYSMWNNRVFSALYLCSVVFAAISLFWYEAFAIWVICAYHLKSLYINYKYEKRHE